MKYPWDELTPTEAKIVKVDWHDIGDAENWNEVDDPDYYQISTVSWLLYESDKYIVLAADYDWTDDKWSRIRVIPLIAPELTTLAEQPAPEEPLSPMGHGFLTDIEK